MIAVLLAAGRGRRLLPMGWELPKCLLQFGSTTLLDLVVGALEANHVDRIVVVVGYREDAIREALRNCTMAVRFVDNPDFDHTNTIHSLYLARDHLNDGFLYFNGDVLFDRRVVSRLLAHDGSAVAVDVKPCHEEEVKVVVDAQGRINRIGKTLSPGDALGEFIGIGKFSKPAAVALVESLRRYNEDRNERNLFFEAAVDDILHDHPISAMPIGDLCAVEVDTPEDYAAAERLWTTGRIQT